MTGPSSVASVATDTQRCQQSETPAIIKVTDDNLKSDPYERRKGDLKGKGGGRRDGEKRNEGARAGVRGIDGTEGRIKENES